MTPTAEPAFKERLLRAWSDPLRPAFITVAIPHYKHRRYLEVVLQSLCAQTSAEFEILISDDNSPDDSNEVIPDLLEQSRRSFRYYAQPKNLGYDGNVRFCLRAASAPYVLLLGNDDAPATPTTLADIAAMLRQLGCPEVAVTNYEVWGQRGSLVKRVLATGVLGSGPDAALGNFRLFSFVSGLIYNRDLAVKYETDRWDQSVFYQIYIGSRIIAAGGRLAALDFSAIAKDVRVDGQTVPNYVTKLQGAAASFKSRHSGLDSVIRVTVAAIQPSVSERELPRVVRRIVSQIFFTSYIFWLFEYRRLHSWSAAVGIARGMWPRPLLAEYSLPWRDRAALWLLYFMVTGVGLIVPPGILDAVRQKCAGFARRRQQRPVEN